MKKLYSGFAKKEIYGAESILKFVFENGVEQKHNVYWLSNGEIFPVEQRISFDTIMLNIYKDPKLEVKEAVIFVNDAPEYESIIYANSKHSVHTNRDLINAYIKNKLKPIQLKRNI